MSYTQRKEATEEEHACRGLEITPKREKAFLAGAYVLAGIGGIAFYCNKDKPKSEPRGCWYASATGEVIPYGSTPNMEYWIPFVFFCVTAVVLLATKVTLWWRHG